MMLPINARVRPNLSAMTPNIRPPAAEASSVIDPSSPAVGASIDRSRINETSTRA